MNVVKTIASTLFMCLLTITLSAQTNSESDSDSNLSLNEGTLDNQFEYIIQKSNNYQNYKVVKKAWLQTLKSHTLDSLQAIRKDLDETQIVVNQQANEIATLKSKLNETQNTLDLTNKEKDSMEFLGMQLSKTTYNTIIWSIIGGLLICLLFFIYKFKNSNSVTRDAKRMLAEIEEEFDEHRKTALEREQKVRRQLQDELNKQKGNV
ncbi:tRNA (guanine-N1)-methyltransferase [Formosa sediminum]|uniref:tRNA (Guanine-N1)-methyltransferase n=1 Tax=Formosa sediminum TaxID=2594004 RepID=A0A516GLP5_9FLAO|nr:tRNA (guanine-N1)-methyltransferase [Formosa sediminum]QDO92447.1 tRNA (guanine-N1)-methyltransferase [Formosa sediminum]